MATGDDALGVRDDGAVVEEDVDVVLGSQQRADVALKYEVRLDGPLDRLLDLRVGLVHEVSDLVTDRLLPLGQPVDVRVDAGVFVVCGSLTS